MEQKPMDQMEGKVDDLMKSDAMKTKVGKLSIGQYLTYNKKGLMVTLILIVVAGILSLIPVVGLFIWPIYLVIYWVSAVYITFMIGYKLAKDNHGEVKEALIGGALLGGFYGLINAIFSFVRGIMVFYVFSAFVGTTLLYGGLFFSLIWSIIGGIIGGLIVSVIGFAIAGGFNKGSSSEKTSDEKPSDE